MKKILVILVATLISVGAYAQQPEKGKLYIGTSVMTPLNGDFTFGTGFNYNQVKDVVKTTITTFGLAPEVGYFVSDKFSLGLGVAYNHSSSKLDREGAEANKVNSFGVNPFVRYYACTTDKFGFYLQGGFSFVSSKADFDGAEADNIFGVAIRPGVTYSISDKFAINASFGNLGFTSAKRNISDGTATEGNEVKTTSFGLNLEMSTLLFGISYKF